MKKFMRILSMVLIICMLCNMLPMQSFATGNTATAEQQALTAGNPEPESITTQLIGEVTEKRTEYSKEFLLSDGSMIAAVYADPIHYEKDGSWKEIDNTLKVTTDGKLVNTAGAWVVALPQSISKTAPVTVTRDGHSLSFTMSGELRTQGDLEVAAVGQTTETATVTVDGKEQTFQVSSAQTVTGQVQTIDTAAAKAAAQHPEVVLDKNASALMYSGVYTNTQLRYDLHGSTLKESVILQSYSSNLRGYRYTLNTGDLIPLLNEDGSILFLDSNKEVVFFMKAPYLIDDNEQCSYDVRVSLTGSNDTYTLTYLLPTAWLASADRAWPVVLDPAITTEPDVMNIRDHTVASNGSYHYERPVLECGYGNSNHVQRIFLKYQNLPTLTSSDVIIDARVALYKIENSDSIVTVDVHKVDDTWESESLTWANKPGYNETIEDYALINLQGYYTWNVTDIVREWYSGENTGMMFKASDQYETGSAATWKQFASSDNGNSAWMPSLQITYRHNRGIEPYYTYQTISAGQAGTAYICDATGQLKVVKSIAGYSSTVNPFSLNLVYNSDYFASDATAADTIQADHGLDMLFGAGFTMDMVQTVEETQIENALGKYLLYRDGDGTNHYFAKQSDGTYRDEDGLGLQITASGSHYTMTNDRGVTWTFTNGILSEMRDETGNTIKISWSTGSNGRYFYKIYQQNAGGSQIAVATVSYLSGTSYVRKLTDAAGRVSTFSYTDGKLTQIQLDGTTVARYTYDGNRLQSLTDVLSGYTLRFTYSGGKVVSVTESVSEESGSSLQITYSGEMTLYRESGMNKSQPEDDILFYYIFDYAGRTINAGTKDLSDNILGISNAVYSGSGTTENPRKNNRTLLSATTGVVAQNLLKDSSFEQDGSSGTWVINTTSGTLTRSTYDKRTGAKAMEGYLNGTGSLSAQQSVTLQAGKEYTFSAYVNTDWISSYSSGGGVCLRVSGNGLNLSSDRLDYNTEDAGNPWTRISVSFAAPAAGSYTVALYGDGFTGWFYADDFQLETGNAPSERNLLENGGLSLGQYGWQFQNGAAYGSGVLSLPGDPLKETRAWQEVTVNLPGTQTYLLSGWATAESVPDNDSAITNEDYPEDTTKSFGLRAVVIYGDGTEETHYTPFCADVSQEQFTSMTIVPKVPEKTVSRIRVICAYEKNSNSAAFDNISLVRQTAQTMEYDDDGNLVNVSTTGLSQQSAIYEGGNLLQASTGNNGTFTYEYDDTYTHRLESASDGTIKQTYSYDTNGNVTDTVLQNKNGGSTLTSSAAYTNDGNRIWKVTDANGDTVEYIYDGNLNAALSLPSSVTDGNGITTYMGYDNFGRLCSSTSVIQKNGVAQDVEIVYTYTKDDLTGITRQTDGQAYSMTHDIWGNTTAISVGDRQLASYSYSAQNGPMTAMTYSNGTTVSYTYDSLGRVTCTTYTDVDQNTTRTLTYTYDGNGQLHSVHDDSTGLTYTCTYDDLGRLIASRQGNMTTAYQYNTDSQLVRSSFTDKVLGDGYETYTYDTNTTNAISDGLLTKMRMVSGHTTVYQYDALQRLSYRHMDSGRTGGGFWEGYSYSGNQVINKKTWNNDTDLTNSFSYSYDGNGNILTENTNGSKVYYTYDDLNQLISVTGARTESYSYDDSGNITSFNNGVTSHTMTYGDAQWKDLLTAVDGQPITYDAIGNPLTYYDGSTMTWAEGRRLQSITQNGGTIAYSYNADGLRTEKTKADGSRIVYHIADGRYAGETYYTATGARNRYLRYTYDESGNVCGFGLWYAGTSQKWEEYYFEKNLQGDVLTVYKESDNSVAATYTYDAWGNILSSSGSLKDLNPFRYRGYYYDTETGFYYLQSRYYNPAIGRFINADGYTTTGQGFMGNNMFAYCGNNPICRADYLGNWWQEFLEYIDDAVQEFQRLINEYQSAYYTFGAGALTDGALPVMDLVAGGAAIALTTVLVIVSFNNATTHYHEEEKELQIKDSLAVTTKRPSIVTFPIDPQQFDPLGLDMVIRPGTKNGMIVSWMIPNSRIEVFRWDQNPNYPNGPHYHIIGQDRHYYPGDIVPEPHASIYFPVR